MQGECPGWSGRRQATELALGLLLKPKDRIKKNFEKGNIDLELVFIHFLFIFCHFLTTSSLNTKEIYPQLVIPLLTNITKNVLATAIASTAVTRDEDLHTNEAVSDHKQYH